MKHRIFALLLATVLCLCGMVSCSSASPLPAATAAVSARETAVSSAEMVAASALWQAFDRNFFIEYLQSDITMVNQFLRDPSAYGIDTGTQDIRLAHCDRAHYEATYTWYREKLQVLEGIPREGLTEKEQAAYDTVKRVLEEALEGESFYEYDEVLLPYTGMHIMIPMSLWFYNIRSPEDADTYLALLASVPVLVDEILEYETYRADTLGIFMTEMALDMVLRDIDSLLERRENIFLVNTYADALEKVEGLSSAKKSTLKLQNRALLENEFHNSYQKLRDGLEALRVKCSPLVGVAGSGSSALQSHYDYRVRTTVSDGKSLQEIEEFMREALQASYNKLVTLYDEAGGYYAGALSLGTVEENTAYLRETLDSLLPPLPEVELTYSILPEELADIVSPASYLLPAYDDWVHNSIQICHPEENTGLLTDLAHEGYNGHLYQYVYSRAVGGFPLSQQLVQSTTYAEAWSQTSEMLLGMYDSRFPKAALALSVQDDRLSMLLYAYGSVIVNSRDISMDAFCAYMQDVLPLKDEICKNIYETSVLMPYYFLNYAYGYARLWDMIDRAREARRSSFDMKAFLADYLAVGPTYFDLIEEKLGAWFR